MSCTPSTSRLATTPRAVASFTERPKALRRASAFCLSVAVGRVLSVEFVAHQLDVAARALPAVQEGPDVLPAIGKDGHQDPPQQLHGRRPADVGLRGLLCCLPVDDRGGNRITVVVCPGLRDPRRERYFKPRHAVALFAHGQPGVLDAAAEFRSANSAITVSAAPSLADEPRVPVSMTLPK